MLEVESKIGIPKYLWEDLQVSEFTKPVTIGDQTYSRDIQNKVFGKTMSNPLEFPYTFLISVDSNNKIAQFGAKHLVSNVVARHGNPFWFSLLRRQSEIERAKHFELEFGGIDFLVIDNVFHNTGVQNIDCLRYLLDKYCEIPKAVVISGIQGPTYFKQFVFCGFERFIHFSDTKRKIITFNSSIDDDLPELED